MLLLVVIMFSSLGHYFHLCNPCAICFLIFLGHGLQIGSLAQLCVDRYL
uniref:Uncharacterized protein n=1 Tax=Arundo donax TaxID=35708 RepID=A0A0A9A217_ARUDO